VILAVTTMLVLRRADTAPPTRIANE
jgi:hypothetical protein